MADTHNIPTTGGAPVGFYRGEQNKLDNLSVYRNGAFYITTDTDRLYYAQSNSELVYLNKSIQVVANQTELFKIAKPLAGEFYYVVEGNILCYYDTKDGTNDTLGDWVQVNVQTIDTDISVESINISDAEADATGLTFNVSLAQKNKDGSSAGEALTDTFKITKEQINNLVDHPANNITISAAPAAADKKYTVSIGGSDATANTSYDINVAGNLSISGENNNVTITGTDTTYKLSNVGETIQLRDNANAKAGADIKFVAGNIDIVLGSTNSTDALDGEIKISHKVYEDPETITGEALTPKPGDKINVVVGLESSNGHVTGIEVSELTLPDTQGIVTDLANADIKAVSANNEGKIILSRNAGEDITSSQDLFYKINNEVYYNQANLDAGIQKYIEENLASVTNALTFKGGLTGSESGIEISALVASASIGDTYIVKEGHVNTNDGVADPGDIVIANGTEENGIITGTIDWIVVPGTEKDTTYTLNANDVDNSIELLVDGGGRADSIILEDDSVVELKATADGKIKASHALVVDKEELTGTQNANPGSTFTAIESVAFDDYGHVSKVKTTTYTVPALPDQTNNHKLAHVENTLTTQLQNAEGTAQGAITFIEGNVINITSANNEAGSDYTINHADVAHTKTEITEANSLNHNTEFTVITDMTVNNQGHVTAFTTQKHKAIDTTYNLSGTTVAPVSGENAVTVTSELKTTDGAEAGSSVTKFISDNSHLIVNGSNNQVNLGLVWGTF